MQLDAVAHLAPLARDPMLARYSQDALSVWIGQLRPFIYDLAAAVVSSDELAADHELLLALLPIKWGTSTTLPDEDFADASTRRVVLPEVLDRLQLLDSAFEAGQMSRSTDELTSRGVAILGRIDFVREALGLEESRGALRYRPESSPDDVESKLRAGFDVALHVMQRGMGMVIADRLLELHAAYSEAESWPLHERYFLRLLAGQSYLGFEGTVSELNEAIWGYVERACPDDRVDEVRRLRACETEARVQTELLTDRSVGASRDDRPGL